MYVEESAAPVLRCTLCNKPFDKHSTLKRHGYYCRSRKGQRPAARARSCLACARVKSRCDNARPCCTRCTDRGIACHYPDKAANQRRPTADSSPSDLDGLDELDALPAPAEPAIDADLAPLDDIDLGVWDAELGNGAGAGLDWAVQPVEFADLMALPSPPRAQSPADLAQGASWPLQFFSPKLPVLVLSGFEPRSLGWRPALASRPNTPAGMTKLLFKSYLSTLLRQGTLPPFIHPQLFSAESLRGSVEPLTNCTSMMQMVGAGGPGSRKLFWKMVRVECERIQEEYIRYNEWELLTAMQAVVIYILMRLTEGETEHNNCDALMLATVAGLGNSLANHPCKIGCVGVLGVPERVGWTEWLFEESRRRLSAVIRVINLLVTIDPMVVCNVPFSLVIAPLPSRKELWESEDEIQWRLASDSAASVDAFFGLARSGELLRLEKPRHMSGNHADFKKPLAPDGKSTENWEDWCASMDSLGTLVMLAASML